MSLEITPCHVKQTVNPKDFDIFYLGGGQDSDQAVITKDLQETKAGALREAFELGAVGLFVCGGYQLAGYSYETKQHGQLDGLGLLDIKTVTGETRLIGDILIEVELGTQPENTQPNNPQPNNPQPDNPRPLQIVGYENHLGRTFLGPAHQSPRQSDKRTRQQRSRQHGGSHSESHNRHLSPRPPAPQKPPASRPDFVVGLGLQIWVGQHCILLPP